MTDEPNTTIPLAKAKHSQWWTEALLACGRAIEIRNPLTGESLGKLAVTDIQTVKPFQERGTEWESPREPGVKHHEPGNFNPGQLTITAVPVFEELRLPTNPRR